MDAVFNSLTELSKYKIVSLVNTGDKVYDNLINAFLLACFAFFSTNIKQYASSFWVKFLLWCGRKAQGQASNGIIRNPELIPKPESVKPKFVFMISFSKNEHVELICKWVYDHYKNANFGGTRNISLRSFSYDGIKTYDNRCWRSFDYFPIFEADKDIIWAHCTYQDLFVLYFNRPQTFELFVKQFPDQSPVQQLSPTEPQRVILDLIDPLNKDSFVAQINPYRTFDTLVFKQKPLLLDRFQKFLSNNQSKSVFLPKNLGILLYGEFGTGKSSILKATCNYFQRPGAVFNFKQKRKAKEFISAMNRCHKSHILMFDEFDYLIKSMRINNSTGGGRNKDKQQQHSKETDTMGLNLAAIQAQMKDCEDKELAKQLRQTYLQTISASTDDVDLDIATMLTVLDGLYDHENRIILATTNNPEDIPSSLLRSGRFDLKLYLTRYEQQEYVDLLSKIFPEQTAQPEIMSWLTEQKFPDKLWAPVDIINVAQECAELKTTVKRLLTTKPTVGVKMPPSPAATDSDSDTSSFIQLVSEKET